MSLPSVDVLVNTRPSFVRERVLAELGQRILSGYYPPGDLLPTEAQLSTEFGVSRTALREAMKMLAAKGMVISRQRAGTKVQPSTSWNRLDAEVLEWMSEMDPDPIFVRGLTEARQVIEPAAAGLAALRATARDLAAMEDAYQGMCAAPAGDIVTFSAADVRFHVSILRASENPIFANLANMIGQALLNSFKFTTGAAKDYRQTLAAHGEVLEAIRMRQSKVAEAKMRALVSIASRDLILAVEQMQSQQRMDRDAQD